MISETSHSLPASGPRPGEQLDAFVVDDVTGDFPGERLCYVCRYGDAPTIILFVQGVPSALSSTVRRLETWRDAHAGRRAFVAAVSNDAETDAEELRDLAAAEGVRLPLTICSEGEFGPHMYRLHPRVPVTAVLYRRKTVVETLTAPALSPDFDDQLIRAAEALVRTSGDVSPDEAPSSSCRLPAART